jgi:ABC-type bacteriocin/lantibiotic exporter with double-glycine peptidase domain
MAYFIKQLGEKDCGYACVKMILGMSYHRKDFLYLSEPSIDSSATLRDLMSYARKEGLILSAYRAVEREEIFTKKVKTPLLMPINKGNFLHMVVVKKITKKRCLIQDPATGTYYLNKKNLLDCWNGEYLEVSEVRGSNFRLKPKRFVPLYMTFFTVFFEILSFISLVLALFFIDGSKSFYWSLALFFSYIVFEFIYRKILILSMKKFDKMMLVNKKAFNHLKFKTRYADITKLKVLSVSNPIQLLSLIMMTIFGIVVLGINSPYNLISISAIVLFQLIFRIFERHTYEYKRNRIDLLERNLNSEAKLSTDKFLERINILNKETYSYVSYCNLKKYILIFLIIALSLLYSFLSGVNSLNFMLFHFFFYLYINDNLEKIIHFSQNYEEYKRYKALYLYYFGD